MNFRILLRTVLAFAACYSGGMQAGFANITINPFRQARSYEPSHEKLVVSDRPKPTDPVIDGTLNWKMGRVPLCINVSYARSLYG